MLTLKKLMGKKMLGPNWSKIILKSKQILVPKRIKGPKEIVGTNKIWVQTNLGPERLKKNLAQEIFWMQNNLKLNQKNVSIIKKDFQSRKIFEFKKFGVQFFFVKKF